MINIMQWLKKRSLQVLFWVQYLPEFRKTYFFSGYGIHVNGTTEWDGKNDAFSQCCPNTPESVKLISVDHGYFQDIEEFYELKKEESYNYQNWAKKVIMAPFLLLSNSTIEKMRDSE